MSPDFISSGFFHANLDVGPTETQPGWTAKASILQHRLNITRCGTKFTGEEFKITELVNFVYWCAPNMPEKPCKSVHKLIDEFSVLIKKQTVAEDPHAVAQAAPSSATTMEPPSSAKTATKAKKALTAKKAMKSMKAQKANKPMRVPKAKMAMKVMKAQTATKAAKRAQKAKMAMKVMKMMKVMKVMKAMKAKK